MRRWDKEQQNKCIMKKWNEKVAKWKKNITADELCQGLPDIIYKYMEYVNNLGFYQKPNYSMLRKMFEIDYFGGDFEQYQQKSVPFDWEMKK